MPIRVNHPSGRTEVLDFDSTTPVLVENATLGVAVIGADGRLYWRVNDIDYYVTGTAPAPAPMIGGVPYGLLLSLTIPEDGGG